MNWYFVALIVTAFWVGWVANGIKRQAEMDRLYDDLDELLTALTRRPQ